MEISIMVRCLDGDGKPAWPEIVPEVFVLPSQGWAAVSAIAESFDHTKTDKALQWKAALAPASRGKPAVSFAGFRLVQKGSDIAEINAEPAIELAGDVLTLDFGTVSIASAGSPSRSKTSAASALQFEPPKNLDDAIARLETTETELKAMKVQASARQPTAAVLSALGSSIGEAANQIAQQQHPFTLGPVTIKLMGSVSDGGTSIQMADSVSAGAAHSISEIALSFEPTDTAPGNANSGATVPNLVGLTQTAATEALSRSGLKHRPATALLKPKRKSEHGRAIEQIPASGALAEHGTEVLVVYGFVEVPT